MSDAVLQAHELRVSFPVESGERVCVVDGVDLELQRGQVLALVGESGCGKSVTALALMRLIAKPGRIEAGSRVLLGDTDLLTLPVPQMRDVRGSRIAMIFQEPMTCLNPVQRVGAQVAEAIRLHQRWLSASAARTRVEQMFERVGIPDPRTRAASYPHQLSGGLKQRVMIAMALAMQPQVLIADEPTTALDVSVQAQILELMRELRRELGTAILLITHDLGVVNEMADRVSVMYAGRIVEHGTRLDVLGGARHPYTRGLLRAIPALAHRGERLQEIEGVVPSPASWPRGCRFAPRCSVAFEPCGSDVPGTTRLGAGHHVCCHDAERAK